jgi:hypothetical protein
MGISLHEIAYGLLTLLVMLIGGWCRSQESKIKELEDFKTKIMEHWERDASNYLSKSEFSEFARELKDSLIRIESKIEKLRE